MKHGNYTTFYVLMEDSDRTMFSKPYPIGQIVETEAEAKAWVAQMNRSYGREYVEVKLFQKEKPIRKLKPKVILDCRSCHNINLHLDSEGYCFNCSIGLGN